MLLVVSPKPAQIERKDINPTCWRHAGFQTSLGREPFCWPPVETPLATGHSDRVDCDRFLFCLPSGAGGTGSGRAKAGGAARDGGRMHLTRTTRVETTGSGTLAWKRRLLAAHMVPDLGQSSCLCQSVWCHAWD